MLDYSEKNARKSDFRHSSASQGEVRTIAKSNRSRLFKAIGALAVLALGISGGYFAGLSAGGNSTTGVLPTTKGGTGATAILNNPDLASALANKTNQIAISSTSPLTWATLTSKNLNVDKNVFSVGTNASAWYPGNTADINLAGTGTGFYDNGTFKINISLSDGKIYYFSITGSDSTATLVNSYIKNQVINKTNETYVTLNPTYFLQNATPTVLYESNGTVFFSLSLTTVAASVSIPNNGVIATLSGVSAPSTTGYVAVGTCKHLDSSATFGTIATNGSEMSLRAGWGGIPSIPSSTAVICWGSYPTK